MAVRPFALGARFVENGRTVRLQPDLQAAGRYTVETSREGSSDVTAHADVAAAVREFAAAWRARLH